MRTKFVAVSATLLSIAGLIYATPASAQSYFTRSFHAPAPVFSTAVAFDESRPLRSLPLSPSASPFSNREFNVRPEEGPFVRPIDIFRDPVVQRFEGRDAVDAPLVTFEGLNNSQNPGMVLPPDPDGQVGPNNYVELVNLIFAVYNKTGTLLAGPTQLGTLWSGFSIPDCTDNSGDPVVLYDRHNDRWLLTQFTTRGPNYYNCVAISKTGDPTGTYYRYAFAAGPNFPDYPKYGNWSDSYLLTSRDFGNTGGYGISVYALEKKQMLAGNRNAKSVHFFLDSTKVPIASIGDGLLPADIDGRVIPANGAPAPIVGTQNTLGPYGATSDALNIYSLTVDWAHSTSSLSADTQLPVAAFNSTFPCGSGRACIPQPSTSSKIDILSYRQRPTWRLAYRKFGTYETMVTNQSVQARAGIAGVRWYEIRRVGGVYSLFQQGTYAPAAGGVDRWMGSIAMDKRGNIGLGYSVSNGTTVFPGIRYTGRRATDPLGMMTLREGTIVKGAGSQLSSFNRWGDYSSLNVDPVDDCTFWYVNEYYSSTSSSNWHTRIGSFKLPGC